MSIFSHVLGKEKQQTLLPKKDTNWNIFQEQLDIRPKTDLEVEDAVTINKCTYEHKRLYED